jgi:sodium-dependent phosphate cotransporter
MAKEENEQGQQEEKKGAGLTWPVIILCIIGAFAALYIFLVGLSLMGTSFKVLGGRGAGNMYSAVDNPISGVMTGVLSTVLVQSSSTSTSIVVAMVADGGLTVKQGIPIIMGANIGTSVTNTIVSMGQSGDRIMLERAFSGATVHDMFNMLTVLTLLPLEVIIGAIQGEGGLLYWLSYRVTESLMGNEKGDKLFTSPVKQITKPVVSEILQANKYVIYALTLAPPEERTATSVNLTQCASLRRLSDSMEVDSLTGGALVELDELAEEGASTEVDELTEDDEEMDVGKIAGTRSLLSKRSERRLSSLEDCSTYYCVSKNLAKQFKKISKSSYKRLTSCDDLILDNGGDPCDEKCYLDAGAFYEDKVENGALVKGGFLEGAGDFGGGFIGLVFSIILLCVGLMGLVKCLKTIFMGNAKRVLKYATRLNDYLALLIGIGVTLVVQSSSVTTSALTPLCGVGVLPIEKMFPMTLGANIGTTCTALIASLVSLKFGAVQIALCHLFFNIIGILVWFPIPLVRKIPLNAAKLLGLYASYFRFLPIVYILFAFVCVPGIGLLVGATIDASVGGGIVLLLFVLGLVGAFVFIWVVGFPVDMAGPEAIPRGPLCYKVLTKEQREEGVKELEEADAELRGLEKAQATP